MYCQKCTEHPLQVTSRNLTAEEIIFYSADFLKVRYEKLRSKDRYRHLTEARHMISHLLRNNTELRMSLKEIGHLLNKRDHTTIINGLKRVHNYMETDEGFKEKLKRLHLHVYRSLKYF
jgi:chromosomal replication initiator protein